MTALPRAARPARVLVLGRSPEVLETILQDLRDLGLDAEGSTDAEHAPDRFDARAFDLIAFGGGLAGATSERVGRAFARQNPEVRLLKTHAPRAVADILGALESAPARPPVDLDAYCARIGYDGPRTPTLDTLRALIALHASAIVFEAIDVLLGRGVDISPAAVDAKLIHARRGGYCYEHNGLFKRALTAMGFTVEGLIGRVRWLQPPGAPATPPSHMVLRVTVDGVPWLADVGFGSCVPTAPLRLGTTEPQATRYETFRLIPFGSALLVQARIDDRWRALYELSPQAQLDVDYELPNWFTSTHPSSHFRHDLIVARTTPEARYTLAKNRLTIRTPDGRSERRVLDADGIERALAQTFDLPVEPSWRPVIEKAAATDR